MQPKELGKDPVPRDQLESSVGDLGSGVPLALRVEEAIGHQGMDLGVDVEVPANAKHRILAFQAEAFVRRGVPGLRYRGRTVFPASCGVGTAAFPATRSDSQ